MVANPMQRKSKTSMILGIIIGILIMGVVAAFLFMQLKTTKEQLASMQASKKLVYVLTQDVESGELVTEDMFSKIEVDGTAIPLGATSNIETIQGYSTTDEDGNRVITATENGQVNKYLEKDGKKIQLFSDSETDGFYIMENGERKNITLENSPLYAKIKLNKNTVVTSSMFSTEKKVTNLREHEYNMISLPATIESGDYVDIRIRMPSGLDYIILSKKQVIIPDIGGVPAENTIKLQLTESELLVMSQAIVEAYMAEGSMLYTVSYTEPGLQVSSVPTYIPSEAAINLITNNPNVVTEAGDAIYNRYQNDAIETRKKIASEVNKGERDEIEGRVKSNTATEVTDRQTLRKNYLTSLTE